MTIVLLLMLNLLALLLSVLVKEDLTIDDLVGRLSTTTQLRNDIQITNNTTMLSIG
jgi:hypothetical protein